MWGVGCIFVEMITGAPAFPGLRDTYDQLEKIFKVNFIIIRQTVSCRSNRIKPINCDHKLVYMNLISGAIYRKVYV
jgi:hypothetical protein